MRRLKSPGLGETGLGETGPEEAGLGGKTSSECVGPLRSERSSGVGLETPLRGPTAPGGPSFKPKLCAAAIMAGPRSPGSASTAGLALLLDLDEMCEIG
jgi:hypothetical protein